MPIYETFSQRQKKFQNQGKEDVYQYDNFPIAFRNQVFFILKACLGPGYSDQNTFKDWELIHNIVAKELGYRFLGLSKYDSNMANRFEEFLQGCSTDKIIDFLDLTFNILENVIGPKYSSGGFDHFRQRQKPSDAIIELNRRFKEHNIGFQFESGELIRYASQFIHSETVKPAINLLNEEGFDGPLDEFFRAYEQYRKGNNEEAISLAGKSFESTIKAICNRKNWVYDPIKDTANSLIQIIIKNNLIPPDIKDFLILGLPRVRNRFGGHGQGEELKEVPDPLVSYALHLAASNIVYLVNAYRAIK